MTWRARPSEATLALAAAALAVPLLAFAGWAAWWRRESLDLLLGGVATRAWGGGLVLALAGGALVAHRAGARLRALAWGAVLGAFLSLLVAAGSRYSGVLELGRGEPSTDWLSLSAGPFARLPSVEILELPDDSRGSVRVRVGGRDLQGRVGEVIAAGADRLFVARVAPAAAMELRRANGEPVEGLLVKLHPGEANEFGFARLPHRVMVPLAASTEPVASAPGRLRLRVQRGKLAVADGTLERGEVLRFEGLALGYAGDERWARLEVRGARPAWYGVAAALGLLGAVAAWLGRERATR